MAASDVDGVPYGARCDWSREYDRLVDGDFGEVHLTVGAWTGDRINAVELEIDDFDESLAVFLTPVQASQLAAALKRAAARVDEELSGNVWDNPHLHAQGIPCRLVQHGADVAPDREV